MKKHFTMYRTILWSVCIFAVCYGSLLLIGAYRDAFPEDKCYIRSPRPLRPHLDIKVNTHAPNDTIYVYTN